MAPLKNLRTKIGWNKETVIGASTGGRKLRTRLFDLVLHGPSNGTNHAGRRKDPLWCNLGLHDLELAGQGIGLGILGPRAVGEGEVEPIEEQGPPGLAGVQSLGRTDVLQVLVVSPNHKW